MYTFKYDSHNQRCTIMNTKTQKGVTLGNVGEGMAVFLKELVFQANKAEFKKTFFEEIMSIEPRGSHETNPFSGITKDHEE